ncbi:hypothetical protein TUM3794_21060 [Shewanella colwelliana]|uniref:Uncharacterized protein n=1 Tax=Shewanella colwelliana TaxID=23 RepID=A0ABQ4P0X6_SHECO|nr:hypothetical protein [Shewanella colwelliana]GIU41149.1 hypothetical protein TUM3794_21060 [Shewanella colwelliana]
MSSKIVFNEGSKILAITPAISFSDLDGSNVSIPEKRRKYEVLPKPDTVIVDDGVSEWIEGLPEHLKCDHWLNVKNIETGKRHWLNTMHIQVSEIS